MSANREASGTEPESNLLQEGLDFLHQARQVRVLHPTEVERIARRLRRQNHKPRHMVLWPAVITLGLVLVVFATFAVAKGGLRSLPIVGPYLGSLFVSTPTTEETKSGRRLAVPKSGVENSSVTSPVVPSLGPPAKPLPAPREKSPGPTEGRVRFLVPAPVKTTELAVHPIARTNPPSQTLRAGGESPERMLAPQSPQSIVPPPMPEEKRNPIVEESRSFASVIEPWHRTHDGSATLSLLDVHERRYPSGYMRLESRMLRAEIYLMQGRESEALSILDTLSLAGIPRARELRTVRGELRIRAGRCAEGKRDLVDVLEKGLADSLAKRAAQAISHCP
jgi:hypothetical protein